jgi:hypothetical protein
MKGRKDESLSNIIPDKIQINEKLAGIMNQNKETI